MKRIGKTLLALTVCLTVALAGYAAVTIDDEGIGWVGKGDVQFVFGWNNKQLQDCVAFSEVFDDVPTGCLEFRAHTDQETTWECRNSMNEKVRERSNTTKVHAVLASTARVKRQVTGFNLNGLDEVVHQQTTGPALNSCPGGPWVYVDGSTVEGEPTVKVLEVSAYGGPFVELTITE